MIMFEDYMGMGPSTLFKGTRNKRSLMEDILAAESIKAWAVSYSYGQSNEGITTSGWAQHFMCACNLIRHFQVLSSK